MKKCTVFIIGSDNLLTASLRTAVRSMSGVEVLEDSKHTGPNRTTTEHEPDIVLFGFEESPSILSVIHSLRLRFPSSRFVVLSSAIEPASLAGLEQLDVAAYLQWQDVNPASLRLCLDMVRTCDIVLASKTLIQHPIMTITEREQAVLGAMAAGLPHSGVASALDLSPRTVKRTVAALQDKLEAPTAFALGARASALGLLPYSPTVNLDIPPSE
jgi:DNA-binding NarL/FixJ family response regulator